MGTKLITLVKYRYEHRAEILKDKLEEQGIECTISNESVLGQIDGVKVMIMQKDFNVAIKIYREIRHLYDNHSSEVVEEPGDIDE